MENIWTVEMCLLEAVKDLGHPLLKTLMLVLWDMKELQGNEMRMILLLVVGK